MYELFVIYLPDDELKTYAERHVKAVLTISVRLGHFLLVAAA